MLKLRLVIFFAIIHASAIAGTADSLHHVHSIQSFLRDGDFHFHLRARSLATLNDAKLTDYAAVGLGGGLAYYSPLYYGFHFGFSGFFTFNVYSSNLDLKDPYTNSSNRYEVMLFDATNPENRSDLDRMEELFLAYSNDKFELIAGRQFIATPFANKQDNRMRPNLFEGIWASVDATEFLKVNMAWLNKISPGGTVEWYGMGEVIGIYSQSSILGAHDSLYQEQTHSKGLGIIALNWHKRLGKTELWHYYAQNLFHLTFMQGEYAFHNSIDVGIQAFYQQGTGNGGSHDRNNRYVHPDMRIAAIGAKTAYNFRKNEFSINYLRISKGGQFIFPREWGREQFFVSLPRERIEGSGNLDAWSLKFINQSVNGMKAQFAVAYVLSPELGDQKHNKYNMPSYFHYYMGLNYALDQYFKGMEINILAVHKDAVDNTLLDDEFRINKVDLWHFDVMLDYKF